MKKTYKSFLYSIFIFMIFFNQVEQGYSAPFQESKCKAVDMVLLIDQSHSMDSFNDREGFRIFAARDIIQRLAVNALIECPEAEHRLAVGYFGSNFEWVNFAPPGQPQSFWANIGNYSNVTNTDTWQQEQVKPLHNKIVVEDMGSTNIEEALRQAMVLLEDLGPSGDLPRSKVVVLITDGNPYVNPEDTNLNNSMPPVVDVLSGHYPYHEPSMEGDVRFWVLALNQEGSAYLTTAFLLDGERITVEDFWKQETQWRGGDFLRMKQNRNEIPYSLNVIYESVVDTTGTSLPCGSKFFYVDPYTEAATIVFAKNRPGISVALVYFGNEQEPVYTIKNGQVFDNNNDVVEDFRSTDGKVTDGQRLLIEYWAEIERSEHYVLHFPDVGRWRIDSLDCPDVKARYQPRIIGVDLVSPSISLPAYEDAPYYEVQQPVFFQAQLVDDGGNSILEDPNYPLDVTLTYSDPEGNLVPSSEGADEWQLSSIGDGVWESENPILVPLPGQYIIEVSAQTNSPDPTAQQTIIQLTDRQEFSMTALDIGRFYFDVTVPEKDAALPLNKVIKQVKQGEPVSVKVQVYDKDGEILETKGVIIDSKPFVASLVHVESQTVIESIALSETGEPGAYAGTFREGDLQTIDPAGEYQISVDFVGEVTSSWVSVIQTESTEFERTLLEGFSFELLEPGSSAILHPTFASACPPNAFTNDVRVIVRLLNLEGEELDPHLVLEDPTQANQLLVGELSGPPSDKGKRAQETIQFEMVDDFDGTGKIFLATVAKDMKDSGNYAIEVKLNPSVLRDDYAAPEMVIEHVFERTDAFETRPSTCRMAIYIASALIASAIIGLIFCVTGGPGGTLTFREFGKSSEYGNIRLNKMRCRSKVKAKGDIYNDLGIKYAKTKKAKTDDGRGVEVTLLDDNGQELFYAILIREQPELFDSEVEIEYI